MSTRNQRSSQKKNYAQDFFPSTPYVPHSYSYVSSSQAMTSGSTRTKKWSRDELSDVAKETIQILEQGQYKTSSGQTISIQDALQQAIKGTAVYFDDENIVAKSRYIETTKEKPMIRIVCGSTLEVTRACVDHNAKLGITAADLLVLNFASARNPGGGFLKGSQAQEESIARSSALYACLTQGKQTPLFYHDNENEKSGFYRGHIIYSPGVPVFRCDQTHQLLASPYSVAFVTAPAVNAGVVRNRSSRHGDIESVIEQTLKERARRIFDIAKARGHTALVLGAWGCGVFQNDDFVIAKIFANLISDPEYVSWFRCVVFAIPDQNKCDLFAHQFNVTTESIDALSR